MLDLKFIVQNPQIVKEAQRKKQDTTADIDAICSLNEQRKAKQFLIDEKRRQLNQSTEQIAKLKRESKDVTHLIEANRKLREEITSEEKQLKQIENEIYRQMIWVPNIPADDIPEGQGEQASQIIRCWGKRKEFDFKPKPHYELAQKLEIVDFERGAKLSGSHFLLFMGAGALLERALINFMLDIHTKEHNYKEVFPPYLVRREVMFATGQLPKLEDDMYLVEKEDAFLIPTAEVPLINIFSGETLKIHDLPIRLVGYSSCFRREAGAYGKETRGMVRIHQFDKVELIKFTTPETSYEELEGMVKDAETILQRLELEYRLVKIPTGDMSFASTKTYDIEVWAPGIEKWLEVSSISNCEDFQARRAQIRYRDKDGKLKYVHTLNGSGIALPRTVIAILENYQNKDGTVTIPQVLCPYMGGLSLIKPEVKLY
jgi:seryl-tRNA synthetase